MESDTAFNLNVGPDPDSSFVVELGRCLIYNFIFFFISFFSLYKDKESVTTTVKGSKRENSFF